MFDTLCLGLVKEMKRQCIAERKQGTFFCTGRFTQDAYPKSKEFIKAQ